MRPAHNKRETEIEGRKEGRKASGSKLSTLAPLTTKFRDRYNSSHFPNKKK